MYENHCSTKIPIAYRDIQAVVRKEETHSFIWKSFVKCIPRLRSTRICDVDLINRV